ncbi:hypothetical protein AX16_004005 [Volvariella volvacea WC 439]|nr:hypothetical protein AX16_004005 [Volvariella volvacea WC 439]
MATPYRVTGTPKIPSAPHPTPASAGTTSYNLPKPRLPRAPIRNPYDTFSQAEFDAWIGGITGALRHALGHEDDAIPTTQTKSLFTQGSTVSSAPLKGQTQFDETAGDTASESDSDSFDGVEDSFAEIKARRLMAKAKGKARDPREGPGIVVGDKQNPIEINLISDGEGEEDQQDAQDLEDELELERSLIPDDRDDEEGSDEDQERYPWQGASSFAVTRQENIKPPERGASVEQGDEGGSDEAEEELEEDEEDAYRHSSPIEIIDVDAEDDAAEDVSDDEQVDAGSDERDLEDQGEDEYDEYSEQERKVFNKPWEAARPRTMQRLETPEYSDEEEYEEEPTPVQPEVIDVDAEDEDPEQPLDDDTSFPPPQYRAPPADIHDPWEGPRTYAQDYYSGGEIRTTANQPLTADYLGSNDEVDAFLTPGVVTPVANDRGSPEEGERDVDEENYEEHPERGESEEEDEQYEDATPPPTQFTSYQRPNHPERHRGEPETIVIDDDENDELESKTEQHEAQPGSDELIQDSPEAAIHIELEEEVPKYHDELQEGEINQLSPDIDIQIQAPSPFMMMQSSPPEFQLELERGEGASSESVDTPNVTTADATPILTTQVDWTVTEPLPDGTTLSEREEREQGSEMPHTGVYHHPPAIPQPISNYSTGDTTPSDELQSVPASIPSEAVEAIAPDLQFSNAQTPILVPNEDELLQTPAIAVVDEQPHPPEITTPIQAFAETELSQPPVSDVDEMPIDASAFEPVDEAEQVAGESAEEEEEPQLPIPAVPAHVQYDFTTLPTPPSEQDYSPDEIIIPAVEAPEQDAAIAGTEEPTEETAGVEVEPETDVQMAFTEELEGRLVDAQDEREGDRETVVRELAEEEAALVGDDVVEELQTKEKDEGGEGIAVVSDAVLRVEAETEPEVQVDDQPVPIAEDAKVEDKDADVVIVPPEERTQEKVATEAIAGEKDVPSVKVDVPYSNYFVSEVVTPTLDEDEITDEDAYGDIDTELEVEDVTVALANGTAVQNDSLIEEPVTEGRLTEEPPDRAMSIAIASLHPSTINTPVLEKSSFLPDTQDDAATSPAQADEKQQQTDKPSNTEATETVTESKIIQQDLVPSQHTGSPHHEALPQGFPMPISADPMVPDPTSRPHSPVISIQASSAEDEIPGLSRTNSTSLVEGPINAEASTSSPSIILPPTVMRALNLHRTKSGTSNTFNGLFTPVVGGSSGDVTPVTPVSAGEPEPKGQEEAGDHNELYEAEIPVQEVGESGDYDDASIASSSPSVNNDPLPPADPFDEAPAVLDTVDGDHQDSVVGDILPLAVSQDNLQTGLAREDTLIIENSIAPQSNVEGTLPTSETGKAKVVEEQDILDEFTHPMSDPDAIPGLGSFSSFNSAHGSPFGTARSSPHPAVLPSATQIVPPSSLPFRMPPSFGRTAVSVPPIPITSAPINVTHPVMMVPRKSTDPILYADPYPYSLSTPGADYAKDEGSEEDMELESSSSSGEVEDDNLDLLYPSDNEIYGPSTINEEQTEKKGEDEHRTVKPAEITLPRFNTDEQPAEINGNVSDAEATIDPHVLLDDEDLHEDRDADGDVDPDFIPAVEETPVASVAPVEHDLPKEAESPEQIVDEATATVPAEPTDIVDLVSPHLEDTATHKSPSPEESTDNKVAEVGEQEGATTDEAKVEPKTDPITIQEPAETVTEPVQAEATSEKPSTEDNEDKPVDEDTKPDDTPEPTPSRPQKRKRPSTTPAILPRAGRSTVTKKKSQIPRYKSKTAAATTKPSGIPRTRKIKPIIKRKEVAKERAQSVESSSSGASAASQLLKPNSRASSTASDDHKPTIEALRPQIPPPLFHAHGRSRHQHILPQPPPQLQPIQETPPEPQPSQAEKPSSVTREPSVKPPSRANSVRAESHPPSPAKESSPAQPREVSSSQAPPPPPPPPTSSQRQQAASSSTPVTRSHCRYHRISIPKTEDGPRVFFLVPGCSLGDHELIEEEEIEDHGDATHEDSLRIVTDIETLDFEDYLFGVIRQLCGPDLIQKQEVFYLPQPGEQVLRKPRPKKPAAERLSHARQSASAYSQAGDNTFTSPRHLSALMRSPGSSRPPHSAAGSASSISAVRRRDSDNITASDLGSDLTDDEDDELGDEPKHTKKQRVASPETLSQASISISTSTRGKGRKVRRLTSDAMAYKPESESEAGSEDEETQTRPRRKRRGTKRSRVEGAPEDDGDSGRKAKRVRTRTVAASADRS